MPLRADKRTRQHIDYGTFWRISSPKDVQHTSQGVYNFVGEVDESGYGSITHIRTLEPMLLPGEKAMAKFETRIVGIREQNAITIGVCSKHYKEEDILPGWSDESGTAIAVDTCEGRLYFDSDEGEPKFCKCISGDAIKCVLVPQSDLVNVSFFCNDQKITQVSTVIPEEGFYGVVALAMKGERVRLSLPEREAAEAIDTHFAVRSFFATHKGEGLYSYVTPTPVHHQSGNDQDSYYIGTVRSKVAIDPTNRQQRSLNVELVDPGELCGIAIGVCSSDYPIDSMPGWGENSVAYHTDIRSIVYNDGNDVQERVAPLTQGDTLQIIVEPIDGGSKEVVIFFRKNGELLGKHKTWNPRNGFHWCLSLSSEGEKLKVHPTYTNMIPIKRVHQVRFEDVWNLPTADIDIMGKGICAYVGHGGQQHIGTIRSLKPLDPNSPESFFEIKIINRGEACHIAVGVCNKQYSHLQLPGWQHKSVGFHCDSGSVYHNSTTSQETGRVCQSGDVIRCSVEGVDGSAKQVNISFYHNGILVNSETEWVSAEGLYASVGMMSRGEIIQLACPLMDLPSLKPGLEGISTSLTKPMRPVTFPLRKIPLNQPFLPQHSQPVNSPNQWSDYDRLDTSGRASMPHLKQSDTEGIFIRPYSPIPGDLKSMDDTDHSLPDLKGKMIESAVQWPENFNATGVFQSVPAVQPDGEGFFIAEPEETHSLHHTPYPDTDIQIKVDTQEYLKASDNGIVELVHQLHHLPKVEKDKCHSFQVLYNIDWSSIKDWKDDDYLCKVQSCQRISLECLSETADGFALARQPLSEKMPYFDVEVKNPEKKLHIGLIWPGVSPNLSVDLLTADTKKDFAYLCTEKVAIITCINGEQHSTSIDLKSISPNDVIGVSASLEYKSGAGFFSGNEKNVFSQREKFVSIQFFQNACPVGTVKVPVSHRSLYPFVYLTPQTTAIFNSGSQLSPLNYFDHHSVPDGFLNFSTNPMPSVSGWLPVHNCQLEESAHGVACISHSATQSGDSLGPSVLQHCLPFSFKDAYFEVTLSCATESYLVICLGAMQKIEQGDKMELPGESSNSLGCYPMLGMVMQGGNQAACIPDYTVEQIKASKRNLRLGVGIEFSSSDVAQPMAEFFFVISSQEVARLVAEVPPTGLFPTIAILNKNNVNQHFPRKSEANCESIATVSFPKFWPTKTSLPSGVGRMAPTLNRCNSAIVLDNSIGKCISCFQGCFPILPSKSYFEIVLVSFEEMYGISIGLAPLAYPLNTHPGSQAPSIGYMANTGCILHNGANFAVSPSCDYLGVKIGCGALFPSDGNRGNIEVFFTVDGIVVSRRLVHVPAFGLFPTVGLNTKNGVVSYDFFALNPLVGSKFQLRWHKLENIVAAQSSLQMISHVHIGIAQLDRPTTAVSTTTSYFKIIPEAKLVTGKLFLGFSNSIDSPFIPRVSSQTLSLFLEVSSGIIIYTQNGVRKSDQFSSYSVANSYGCGIEPIVEEKSLRVFFSQNDQVVYTAKIGVRDSTLYPCICMVGCSTKVQVDASAIWPPHSSIGSGWSRYQCLKYSNGYLTQEPLSNKKDGIGFAQACKPLTSSNSYFEVEILRRSPSKAIAIGLGSRQYSMSHWLGWKPGSIAYHADDGNLFKSSGSGMGFGPKYGPGDVVGCGACFPTDFDDMKDGSRIDVFFTLNGVKLGTHKVLIPPQGLFPTVCLESPSEAVCVNFHCPFPPFLHRLSSIWGKAFCIRQTNQLLQHTFQMNERNKAVKYPEAFCQARNPLSTQQPYFEVQIIDCDESSLLSVGVAPLQDNLTTAPQRTSVLFNIQGRAIVLTSDSKPVITSSRQRLGPGDVLGCYVINISNGSCAVKFYCNKILILTCPLPPALSSQSLHPTIILKHPKDCCVPLLSVPPLTTSDRSLNFIGWLRSDNLRIKNSILEYQSSLFKHPGVAQMSKSLSRSHSYIEIEVLSLGERGTISIGAAAVNHPLQKHPGWVVNSIGYHGDDGRLFHCSGTGVGFGPNWNSLDVIGVGIRNYECESKCGKEEVQVYFTRNGIELGHTTMTVPENGLFPSVGCHSVGERVKIHSAVQQQFSSDKARLRWRALVGLKYSYSAKCKKDILSFIINGRISRNSVLPDGLGIAIGYTPMSVENSYFEVDLLNLGDDQAIAIGAVPKNYHLENVPGWLKGSVAYHTDDGSLYKATSFGKPFGPVPSKGDTVGCGISFLPSNSKHCIIFFTHNRVEMGCVRCAIPEEGFFPAVAMCSRNAKVSVTFKESFKSSYPVDPVIVGLMRSHNCSYSDKILKYSGGTTDRLATAHFNVALTSTRNFFSANLINHGDEVLIGLAVRDYPESHQVGESSFSIAYNITSGKVKAVCGHDIQTRIAERCSVGDTIGCGLEWNIDKKESPHVFFTKNGLAICRLQIPALDYELFPVVGIVPIERQSVVRMDWSCQYYDNQNQL